MDLKKGYVICVVILLLLTMIVPLTGGTSLIKPQSQIETKSEKYEFTVWKCFGFRNKKCVYKFTEEDYLSLKKELDQADDVDEKIDVLIKYEISSEKEQKIMNLYKNLIPHFYKIIDKKYSSISKKLLLNTGTEENLICQVNMEFSNGQIFNWRSGFVPFYLGGIITGTCDFTWETNGLLGHIKVDEKNEGFVSMFWLLVGYIFMVPVIAVSGEIVGWCAATYIDY